MPTVRIPQRLMNEIKRQAVREERSAAKQLIVLLKEYYKKELSEPDVTLMSEEELQEYFNEEVSVPEDFP